MELLFPSPGQAQTGGAARESLRSLPHFLMPGQAGQDVPENTQTKAPFPPLPPKKQMPRAAGSCGHQV